MFLSIRDKIEFISTRFGVRVDDFNDDEDLLHLEDGNSIAIQDAQCTHFYKGIKYFESADISIELRDYFIEKFDSQGKIEKKVAYCRLCEEKIAEELETLGKKEEQLTFDSDKQALQQHRELLHKQSFKVNNILSNYTVGHEFSESESDNDDINQM